MTNLIALHGRAMFDQYDVSSDTEAPADQRGPWLAWMLFTWKVNEMVPETFATEAKHIQVKKDEPAIGWYTEQYKTARVMHPPEDSGNMILIQADTPSLYPIWDQAMQQVVAGGIHRHIHKED